jgi:hypothetical protein
LLPMNEGDIEIKSDFYLLKIKEKRTWLNLFILAKIIWKPYDLDFL